MINITMPTTIYNARLKKYGVIPPLISGVILYANIFNTVGKYYLTFVLNTNHTAKLITSPNHIF